MTLHFKKDTPTNGHVRGDFHGMSRISKPELLRADQWNSPYQENRGKITDLPNLHGTTDSMTGKESHPPTE